ncbi:MAG: CXXX repeat peptide maturase [Paraprevotella sp.]|nr:CXXX repeat peptide maturase [Paraprevotella sp.]
MLQYLIILLDDTSYSYCHYSDIKTERRLIGLDTLKRGILFAMKENLNIQFVYPDYELPEAYREVIDSIDHTDIKPSAVSDGADVVVVNGCRSLEQMTVDIGVSYVLRTDKSDLFANYRLIMEVLTQATRVNVVLTDVETFTDDDFAGYKRVLGELSENVEKLYVGGKTPQLNILTDRMMLDRMNNCGAGDNNLTLAPNGKFYVCPAFYMENETNDVGDLDSGLHVKNKQLYKLDHAPLCRICDAWQCKRCVWLNRKTTLEVNTPGHEQCVAAHLERNASRELLSNIRKCATFLPEREEIKEITYLDPFEIKEQW